MGPLSILQNQSTLNKHVSCTGETKEDGFSVQTGWPSFSCCLVSFPICVVDSQGKRHKHLDVASQSATDFPGSSCFA